MATPPADAPVHAASLAEVVLSGMQAAPRGPMKGTFLLGGSGEMLMVEPGQESAMLLRAAGEHGSKAQPVSAPVGLHNLPHVASYNSLHNGLQHTDSANSLTRQQAGVRLSPAMAVTKPGGATEAGRVSRSCTLNRISSKSDLQPGVNSPNQASLQPTKHTRGRRFLLLLQRTFACMGPEHGPSDDNTHQKALVMPKRVTNKVLPAAKAKHLIDSARDASGFLHASGLSQLTDPCHVWPSATTSNQLSDASRIWPFASLAGAVDSRAHSGSHGCNAEPNLAAAETGVVSGGPTSTSSLPTRPGPSASQTSVQATSLEDLTQAACHTNTASLSGAGTPLTVGPSAAATVITSNSVQVVEADDVGAQDEQPKGTGVMFVPVFNSPSMAANPTVGSSVRVPARLSRQLDRQQIILPAPAHTVAAIFVDSPCNSSGSLAIQPQQQDAPPASAPHPRGPHDRSSAGSRGIRVGAAGRLRRSSFHPSPDPLPLRESLSRFKAAISLGKAQMTEFLPSLLSGNSGSQDQSREVSRELSYARAPRFSSSRGRMQTFGVDSGGGASLPPSCHGTTSLPPRGSGLRTCTSTNSLHTMAGGQGSTSPWPPLAVPAMPHALQSGNIFMLQMGLVGTRASAGGGEGLSTGSSITGAGTDRPNVCRAAEDSSCLSLSSKLHLGSYGEFPVVHMQGGSMDACKAQRCGSYSSGQGAVPVPPQAQLVYCHPLMARMCLQRQTNAARAPIPTIGTAAAQVKVTAAAPSIPRTASLPYLAGVDTDSQLLPSSPFSLSSRVNSCGRFTSVQGHPHSPCFLITEGQPQLHSPPSSPAAHHAASDQTHPPPPSSVSGPGEIDSIAPSRVTRPTSAHAASISSLNGVMADPACTLATPYPEGEPKLSLADFQPLLVLSKGYAADVHQAFCVVMGRMCIMKTYHLERLDAMGARHMRREVAILAAAAGMPGVVRLWAAFQEDEHMVLVLDFCDAGDLQSILARHGGRLSENHAVRKVLHPLLTALQALHGAGFVHRDIKLSNICFTRQGELRLCDLGLAIDTRHEKPRSRVGTQGYMAPELLNASHSDSEADEGPDAHQPHAPSPVLQALRSLGHHKEGEGLSSGGQSVIRGQYAPAAESGGHMGGSRVSAPPSAPPPEAALDIWSVGVTAHIMMTGRKPYTEETLSAAMQSGLPLPPLDLDSFHLPLDAQHFLRVTLEQHPEDRPLSTELLNHPWLVRVMAKGQAKHPVPTSGPSSSPAAVPVKAPKLSL